MCIVHYMVHADENLISTMAERSKAKTVRCNLKLTPTWRAAVCSSDPDAGTTARKNPERS
jgi:hypothetical protein